MRPVRIPLLVLVAVCGVAAASALSAQERPAVEVRAGAVVPMGGFRDGLVAATQLRSGPSFTVFLSIPRRERSTILLGFGQQHLGCSGSACGGAGTLVSTSWNAGMRWFFRPGRVGPWVRAALLLDRSEATFLEDGSSVRRASYLGIGAEVGAGVAYDIRERIRLLPGVRLAAIDTRFPDFGPLRMRYAVADVAVVFSF